jgi:endonuclease/exonuclease/phosphatase family metal-dependent hydrolase
MEPAAPISSFCPEETIRASAGAPADTTELRWYRASEERDVRLASRWCATVGPPVFRLVPTATFPSWESAGAVDVVTWNMQIGGGDLYRFLDGELGLDCSGARPVLRSGARPFVLLLQEVWRYSEDLPVVESSEIVPWTIDPQRETGEDPDIIEAANRCGLSFLYVPSARNGADDDSRPKEDKGNAILSTLSLTAPIAFDLPLEGGRKVALAVTSASPRGERVRFVTTHLDVASTLFRSLASGNQTRARQTLGLIDGIAKAERDGPLTQVVVVGGDFNTWAGNESSIKFMQAEFPDSPKWDDLGTRGAFAPDHFFFRRRAYGQFSVEEYRRIEDTYGSDHNGRRLTLVDARLRDDR